MPKLVDHDERREQIVAAARRVVASLGMEATTVRRIATEAGCSSGVLHHYFRDKDDILLHALKSCHAGIHERLRRELAGLHGLAALRAMLLDTLPIDAQRLAETRLEMQFWARSLAEPELIAVYLHESSVFRRAIERYLGEALADGSLSAFLDVAQAAEHLHAFVDGISVQATLEPSRLPADRQAQMLDDGLATLPR